MTIIEEKIKNLPPELQHEVVDFIDYLLEKKVKKRKGKRPYGMAKGEIKLADDFTAPLDEEILKEWGML